MAELALPSGFVVRECARCGHAQPRHPAAQRCLCCGGPLLEPGRSAGERFEFPCPYLAEHVHQIRPCTTCQGTGRIWLRGKSRADAKRKMQRFPSTARVTCASAPRRMVLDDLVLEARQDHSCAACGRPIRAGERYRCARGHLSRKHYHEECGT